MAVSIVHRIRPRVFGALLGVVVLGGALSGTASAATATQDIGSASSGPLTQVHVGTDLSCQVSHTGDTVFEFYPSSVNPGDCGTFLASGGTLYAPDFASHGGTATGSLNGGSGYTAFTPVSQSGVTGSGTAADPFRVVTTVTAGALTLTQTDSYVAGNEFYDTDTVVSNSTDASVTATLYHAGDCFLQNSDSGFGAFDSASGTTLCTENANNSPLGRILGFTPRTGGSHYVETEYSTVWGQITAAGAQFPDTCDCTVSEDNGAGLSWPITVPATGSTTVSVRSTFSPTGNLTPPDSVPPTSTGAVAACSGTVTVTVTDNAGGSGPKNVLFKIDGGAQQSTATASNGQATITVPSGKHSVEFWGQDVAGNQETAHHTVTAINDTGKPNITITSNQHKNVYLGGATASLKIKASDALSTLKRNPSSKRRKISTSKLGEHTLHFTAVDACGNKRTKSFTYRVIAAARKHAVVHHRPRFTG